MAMPSSGCIALRTCIIGCACSSISCAVAGIACSPASLSSLSVQASKSAPHGMREFYGYAPVTTFSVNVEVYNESVNIACLNGTACLRCCTGGGVCSISINQTGFFCSWSWSNVSGCVYVDMSSVNAFDQFGDPLPFSTYDVNWFVSPSSGSGTSSCCFNSAKTVEFQYYDSF